MSMKGAVRVLIPASLISIFVWFFVIGPMLEDVGGALMEELSSDSLCPQEFSTLQYKVCFNGQGEIIADGQFNEPVSLVIDGTLDSCRINTGNYDFEFTGCRMDKFKQLEAYSVVLISNKGRVSLSGKELLSRIGAEYQIIKIKPKELSWIRKVLPFIRFV